MIPENEIESIISDKTCITIYEDEEECECDTESITNTYENVVMEENKKMVPHVLQVNFITHIFTEIIHFITKEERLHYLAQSIYYIFIRKSRDKEDDDEEDIEKGVKKNKDQTDNLVHVCIQT